MHVDYVSNELLCREFCAGRCPCGYEYHVFGETVAYEPSFNTATNGVGISSGELDKAPHTRRDSPTQTNRDDGTMRPYVSEGDPSQFIVSGSIGDQRVRILVDTGATISFISSELVPMLTPKPEVKTSELSVYNSCVARQ